MPPSSRLLVVAVLGASIACDRGVGMAAARGTVLASVPRVVINEIMVNPRAIPDEQGEWIELRNLETRGIDLRGWTIASANDRGVTVDRSIILAPTGLAVLARDAAGINAQDATTYVYGSGVALGNGADWVALRLSDGRTVDSVAWTGAVSGASRALSDPAAPHADVAGAAWVTSATPFGRGDLGTPSRDNGAESARAAVAAPTGSREATSPAPIASREPTGDLTLGDPARDSTLVIRVLDVGQGDAILVENGGSRVLIDGGPEPGRFGQIMERLAISGTVVDAVILTHQHYDHYAGLRELFRTRRRVTVRYLFENKDPYSNPSLSQLRDSIIARSRRGTLTYRDTDDPCGTGGPSCTITMRGGARVHLLRPHPQGDGPNNRSVAVRLVAADSTRFSMWLAGDAEQQAIAWFDATDYDRAPGMAATVLKGDHHGSCDGLSARYLDLVRPQIVALSLAARNDYGYVHTQTLDLLARRRIPWYRTDQNGTITITVPARGAYAVSVERGGPNMRGPSDRRARDCGEDDPRRSR